MQQLDEHFASLIKVIWSSTLERKFGKEKRPLLLKPIFSSTHQKEKFDKRTFSFDDLKGRKAERSALSGVVCYVNLNF
jgi:hypothetical protein